MAFLLVKQVVIVPDPPVSDQSHVATGMYEEVRVLCWVMTMPENLQKKPIHVNATWGPRCNKILYMSDLTS